MFEKDEEIIRLMKEKETIDKKIKLRERAIAMEKGEK